MFLPGHKDLDLEKMTVREIAEMTLDVFQDDDFKKILGDFQPTKEQYLKLQVIADVLIKKSHPKEGLTKDSLNAFKAGIAYGIAMSAKMTVQGRGFEPKLKSGDMDAAKTMLRIFAMPFMAAEEGIKHWADDHWFDALMKNAKVEPAPKNTSHDTSTPSPEKKRSSKKKTD